MLHRVLGYLALVDKPGFRRELAELIEELQALDQSENQINPNLIATTNKFTVNIIENKDRISDNKKRNAIDINLSGYTPSKLYIIPLLRLIFLMAPKDFSGLMECFKSLISMARSPRIFLNLVHKIMDYSNLLS